MRVVTFLGTCVELPDNVYIYAEYYRTFEQKKAVLMQVLGRHIQRCSYIFDEDIEQSMRSLADEVVDMLMHEGVYCVTRSDLFLNSVAYEQYKVANRECTKALAEIGIAEVNRIKAGMAIAEQQAYASTGGVQTTFISGGVGTQLACAFAETWAAESRRSRAEQEYQRAMRKLADSSGYDRNIRERLTTVDYPAIAACLRAFVDELLLKFLVCLAAEDKFDYESVKHMNVAHSNELLTLADRSPNKARTLLQAFMDCPFNPAVFAAIIQYDLIDMETCLSCAKLLGENALFEMACSIAIKDVKGVNAEQLVHLYAVMGDGFERRVKEYVRKAREMEAKKAQRKIDAEFEQIISTISLPEKYRFSIGMIVIIAIMFFVSYLGFAGLSEPDTWTTDGDPGFYALLGLGMGIGLSIWQVYGYLKDNAEYFRCRRMGEEVYRLNEMREQCTTENMEMLKKIDTELNKAIRKRRDAQVRKAIKGVKRAKVVLLVAFIIAMICILMLIFLKPVSVLTYLGFV
ncbi:MAG: hypothetical protein IJ438_13505 [Clostridia bacterium]|nr:hypothetical protein [Clostridia bacterium]